MNPLSRILTPLALLARWTGAFFITLTRDLCLLLSVVAWVAWKTMLPSTWRRPVRVELVRQIYHSGVVTLRPVAVIAVFAGIGVFFQLVRIAGGAGQVELTRGMLVVILAGYAGPLLAALLVIGRSGTAIIGELAAMRQSRQIDMLDAQGIDSFDYVIVPRVIALTISVPLLTVAFIVLTLIVGHAGAVMFGVAQESPLSFINKVLVQMTPRVYANAALKSVLSGFFVGGMACMTDFRATESANQTPRLLPMGFVRCTTIVFTITALVSTLI